jgi:hypothetical protein
LRPTNSQTTDTASIWPSCLPFGDCSNSWENPKQPHYGIPGARKKKIIVAIARQFAVDLWRLATGRTTAAALGLQVSA